MEAPLLLQTANGTVTDTFEYDTYGKLTARTGTTKTPFLYNGRDGVMYEDDTGLIYMRARYYSPALSADSLMLINFMETSLMLLLLTGTHSAMVIRLMAWIQRG